MSNSVRRGYIKQVAKQLRLATRIAEPPVDLRLIASACGLQYQEVDYFPDEVDALIICSDEVKVAVVNRRQSEARRRFSLAHEIGHYILHRNGTDWQQPPTIDVPPDSAADAVTSLAEHEANLFAGELLVPVEYLKKLFRPGMTAADVATIFGVSESVAAIAVSSHMRALFKTSRPACRGVR
jgi:Zn-dependent peptidase ImmA (M78 family)